MPVISTNTAANSAVRYLNINATQESSAIRFILHSADHRALGKHYMNAPNRFLFLGALSPMGQQGIL